MSACELGAVDADADVLHLGEHRHERRLDVVVERRAGRWRRATRASARSAGDTASAWRAVSRPTSTVLAAEVELARRRGGAGGQLELRVAGQHVARWSSGSRPGRAGRRRAWCRWRRRAAGAWSSASSRLRRMGLAGWAAMVRRRERGAQGVAHRRCRRARSPGSHATSAGGGVDDERQALDRRATVGAGPRRGDGERAVARRPQRPSAATAAAGVVEHLDLGLEHVDRRSCCCRGRPRAPRPAGRRGCGTRGSRTAPAPRRCRAAGSRGRRGRRAARRLAAASSSRRCCGPGPRARRGSGGASASARRRARRCRRARRRC